MKRYWLLAIIATIIGLMPMVACNNDNGANASNSFTFNLVQASDPIASCLPDATAEVTVSPNEETEGVDTLKLQAQGLPSNTTFAVFLTEMPVPPFGAVQYIADFTTNGAGNGAITVNAIIVDAFSSTLVDSTRVRKELNHVVFWFADPAADEFCVPASTPTPFDGDGEAGVAAMSSKNALPGAPIP